MIEMKEKKNNIRFNFYVPAKNLFYDPFFWVVCFGSKIK